MRLSLALGGLARLVYWCDRDLFFTSWGEARF
jgi:hypothetical protein